MDLQIIIIYVFCDEVLRQNGFKDDGQVKMTQAEVMTVLITSALFFSGHWRRALYFLSSHRYILNVLSESHFNRRIHRIPEEFWQQVFSLLSTYFHACNPSSEYVVDSFPVACCENIRIFHSKLYSGNKFRGYVASKKKYFYGIKVHMIVTAEGYPVEFIFTPASTADIKAFKSFELAFSANCIIYADRAYNSYEYEDLIREFGIKLIAHRRKNSKRKHSKCMKYLLGQMRKRVEVTFSQITRFFPKSIHAVTSRGFELKVFLFILAFSLKALM